MGYIKHHAIIVTSFSKENIEKAAIQAREIFYRHLEKDLVSSNLKEGVLVSYITKGVINSQYSFFIAPDGSKEGWNTSNVCDLARSEFCQWLAKEAICDFVEITFGGDDSFEEISYSPQKYYEED